MKLEKFKEKKSMKVSIVLIGLISILAVGYLISRTYAAYQERKNTTMMEGSFDYFQGSDVYFAFYQDGTQVTTMPTKESGYLFDSLNTICTNGASVRWNQDEWAPYIENLTQTKTKCTLYFKHGKNLGEELLKNETGKTTVTEAKATIEAKGTPDFTQVATTNEGMFAAEDDYTATTGEKSYYYRGAVENNFVKFAGYYWRIIRINGNGSIRMIYNGDKPDQTGEHTIIAKTAFNSVGNNPAYAGYMYGNVLNTSYEQTHANEIDSTIKKTVDKWYIDAIYRKGCTSYISDEIFCNDRSASGNPYLSSSNIFFIPFRRLEQDKNPTLICPQENDKFTTKEATIGNKALTYPVGLITADEVSVAGMKSYAMNESYYLCTSQGYWTMSPSSYSSGTQKTSMWTVSMNGATNYNPYVTEAQRGVRPVLNLKADTQILVGNGTSTNPYVVN